MYFGVAKIDACRFVPDNEQRFTTFEFANVPKAPSEIIEDFCLLRIRHWLKILYHHWPGVPCTSSPQEDARCRLCDVVPDRVGVATEKERCRLRGQRYRIEERVSFDCAQDRLRPGATRSRGCRAFSRRWRSPCRWWRERLCERQPGRRRNSRYRAICARRAVRRRCESVRDRHRRSPA